jgi:hypothetical protein
MSIYTILVQGLNNGFLGLESFYQQIVQTPQATGYMLDLKRIGFLRPPELVALVTASRYLAQKCGQPVQIVNPPENVLLYLERMNVFTTCREWLESPEVLPENRWERAADTDNLLELTPITSNDDVLTIADRTRRICTPLQLSNLSKILSTLSELCSNAWEHSGDRQGLVLIQRYYHQQLREKVVCIAIGDMGRGIRGSLVERHGEFGQRPIDYLVAVLNGKTSRVTGRGGLGLPTIEATVVEEKGQLWLRSETVAILSRGAPQRRQHESLAHIPGTQVVVELTSRH